MPPGAIVYSLPNTSRITTMIKTSPIPPLGPYPHDLLCGQAGIIPKSSKTKITSKIVPSDMIGSFFIVLCQMTYLLMHKILFFIFTNQLVATLSQSEH
jgi:hypothetical protein